MPSGRAILKNRQGVRHLNFATRIFFKKYFNKKVKIKKIPGAEHRAKLQSHIPGLSRPMSSSQPQYSQALSLVKRVARAQDVLK